MIELNAQLYVNVAISKSNLEFFSCRILAKEFCQVKFFLKIMKIKSQAKKAFHRFAGAYAP